MSLPTHYDALGIDEDATLEQVRTAYRRKVRSAHPDTGGSAELFTQVQAAYDTLKDAGARASYDRSLVDPVTVDDEEDIPEWGTSVPVSDPTPKRSATPPGTGTGPVPTTRPAPAPGMTPENYVAPTYARTHAKRVTSTYVGGVRFMNWRGWSLRVRVLVAACVLVTAAANVTGIVAFSQWWAYLVPFLLWGPAIARSRLAHPWIADIFIALWVLVVSRTIFVWTGPSALFTVTVGATIAAVAAAWYPAVARQRAHRKQARADYRRDLVNQWARVHAASESQAGVLYWVQKAKEAGRDTACVLVHPITGQARELKLTGRWERRMWVVVAHTGVLEFCWEDSRKAAGAPHPERVGATA